MATDVLPDVTRLLENLSPEQNQMLERWGRQVQGVIAAAVKSGGPAGQRAKNWLNGVWLGHPLHPALTDATIGAWTTGALLDLVGAREPADAAMTVGVVCAVPTALAGAADWVDAGDQPRPIGLVHAALNTVGLTFMIASLFARRAERRAMGIGLSTLGLTIATISAWLGGQLVYHKGTNVSRVAFEPPVEDWQVVTRAESVPEGKLVGGEVNMNGTRVPIVMLKRGGTIMALSGTCTHWGGPLAEGKLVEGDCVQCPWHASQFRMADGSVQQGPASVPENAFEVRVMNGNVEVRSR